MTRCCASCARTCGSHCRAGRGSRSRGRRPAFPARQTPTTRPTSRPLRCRPASQHSCPACLPAQPLPPPHESSAFHTMHWLRSPYAVRQAPAIPDIDSARNSSNSLRVAASSRAPPTLSPFPETWCGSLLTSADRRVRWMCSGIQRQEWAPASCALGFLRGRHGTHPGGLGWRVGGGGGAGPEARSHPGGIP